MIQDPNMPRGYTKEVWFIPGANSTANSFNYIKEALQSDSDFNNCLLIDVNYNCQENLASIVKVLTGSAPRDRQLYIIGHSLGGVLGVAISQRIKHFDLPIDIRAILTMGSPFGGSESADYLRWMYPSYNLFKSVSSQSRLILELNGVGSVIPTLSLVTTSGNNPLFPTANDGVVTVKSQRSLPKATYIEVPQNHFEVLLSRDTVDHVKVMLQNK